MPTSLTKGLYVASPCSGQKAQPSVSSPYSTQAPGPPYSSHQGHLQRSPALLKVSAPEIPTKKLPEVSRVAPPLKSVLNHPCRHHLQPWAFTWPYSLIYSASLPTGQHVQENTDLVFGHCSSPKINPWVWIQEMLKPTC